MIHDADDLGLKASFFASLNPETDTWLVADLQSKNRLQAELLKTHPCLPENAVLRVSELWRKILNRVFVDTDVVSNQFMSTLLAEWLKKSEISWARHPGTAGLLLQYIGEFLPVLSKRETTLQMVEWLHAHPDAFMRWGNWFVLAHEAWQHFCERKILASTWVSAYLVGQEWSPAIWGRRLIVDAGSDLTGVEVDLFRRFEAEIFAPSAAWCAAYNGTLWPYDLLTDRAHRRLPLDAKALGEISCSRFTTRIAEVKAATAQVRAWLDAGILPSTIGILAADIESYWPALSGYLQKEGVPVEKDVVIAAASLPAVARWVARLKIESHEIESGPLEMSIFQPSGVKRDSGAGQHQPPVSFERFQQLFNRIYDERDLDRDKSVRCYFELSMAASERMARDGFFAWALKYWQDEPTVLERVAASFLQECPANIVLELRSWISYLTALIAKIEIRMTEADVGGVFCGNLESAQNSDLTHVLVAGMSEEELRPQADLSISHADILRLVQDLGVTLNSPDRDENEYLAARIATRTRGEVKLYFATTDFSGQAQAPALFWLREALKKKTSQQVEQCESPASTRWDELQTYGFDEGVRAQAVRRDLDLEASEKFTPAKAPTYSASQLEKYLQCPFVFTAEKLFHLSDLPDVDLDVDAMTSGNVLHALVERLLAPPLVLSWSEAELAKLVDQIRFELKLPLADDRLWPAKRRQFVRTAQNFLTFERDWRAQFARTETVARELDIEGEFALTLEQSVRVRGKIDRVDKVAGANDDPQYVVIDYKSSGGALVNHGSWLDNDRLQLAFYSLALQEQLSALPKGTVIGAFYFVLSNLSREKGVRVREAVGPLFEDNTRNRTSVSAEAFQELLENVRARVADTISRLESGELYANPKDPKDCDQCHWSTVCRAPHLN